MSLYHEASQVLESARINGGSIKSHVFSKKTWKSDPKALFALTTEASKWSEILAEVTENSGVLKAEKQLSPTLSLLLAHDLLLSKRGLGLPRSHSLHTAISRHKARLTAELTKSRLRRGFPSLDALRGNVNGQIGGRNGHDDTTSNESTHPRWIRINTLRTSLDEQLKSTFASYTTNACLQDVSVRGAKSKLLHVDANVPNLIAIPSSIDIVAESAYKEGKLILQDKASCFPALLLDPGSIGGDIIDACAAPGNKTTHLAALFSSTQSINGRHSDRRRILACERDSLRSQTLAKMVKLAGTEDIIHIKAKQDFTRLDPQSKEFANVACLLLDPSCSGSGIVGRDEVSLEIHLPDVSKVDEKAPKSRKRKRNDNKNHANSTLDKSSKSEDEEKPIQLDADDSKLKARLAALSTFQLRLLRHAMAFPAAQRITYSTCSIYSEENEHVVAKALMSDIAKERGWRILKRRDQVEGLRNWKKRGKPDAVAEACNDNDSRDAGLDNGMVADACIRCEKNSEDGTMGFFVAGFVRDVGEAGNGGLQSLNGAPANEADGEVSDESSDEDEWNGFSDEEAV